MCFSAEASFAGAAVVGGIGVATLTKVRAPRELLYGALPLAFAVHQFLEGVTWVRLNDQPEAVLADWPVRLWVIYAWALLPLWVPLAVWLLEPDERSRRRLIPFIVVGAADLAYMAIGAFEPAVSVRVVSDNLDYVLPYPAPVLVAAPYILTTCLAPMLSSYRWVRAFGAANIVALALAAWIQSRDFSSIWCTFAAFLSVLVLLHFREMRRDEAQIGVPAPQPA